MNPVTIERLAVADFELCTNIWNMGARPALAQRFRDELVSGNRIIFVAVLDGAFVGEGDVVFDTGDSDYTIIGKRIYLSHVIVKRDFRRHGIGSVIVDRLTEFATDLGYREFSIGVDVENIAARTLYEKKGFTEIIFEGRDEGGNFVKLLRRA